MRRTWLFLANLAAMVVIWILDVGTPPELAFSVFYLVPIGLTAWFIGLRLALLAAVAGALLWAAAEVAGHPDVALWVHAWNAATRGVIFIVLAYLTNTLVREREKLRAIDRQREEALSFVAHELRGSVAAIEAAVPAIAEAKGLDDAQRKTLGSLRRQANTLDRFAEDVLAVGRLEQGRFELRLVDFDLGDLVTRAARGSNAPERIQLVVPTEPVLVRVDPERCQLAIEHLISNALKYSAPTSIVFVRLDVVEGTARLDVRDDGIGLAAPDHAVLFQKYGRVRNTRTAHVLGVGLGLYVTRLLVQANGGAVAATSVGPGMGSTFTITLPLANQSRAEAHPTTTTSSAPTSATRPSAVSR